MVGPRAHHEVSNPIAKAQESPRRNGTHSAALPLLKIFRKLMGTTCDLKWREIGENERLWVIEPGHPIAQGIGEYIDIPRVEMYGERFDIPAPDTLVFVSWYPGGEVFRSGCCYHRGRGKVFYFRPGHETFPIFHQPEVQQVLENAVRWAAPVQGPVPTFGHWKPVEKLDR